MSSRVDLPQPLGPTMAVIPPAGKEQETLASALVPCCAPPAGKRCERCSTLIDSNCISTSFQLSCPAPRRFRSSPGEPCGFSRGFVQAPTRPLFTSFASSQRHGQHEGG